MEQLMHTCLDDKHLFKKFLIKLSTQTHPKSQV